MSTIVSATSLDASTWRYTRSQQRTHRRRIEAQECNVGAAAQNGCARSPIFSAAGKAVANVQLGLPFVEARTSGIEYNYDLSRVPDLFGVNRGMQRLAYVGLTGAAAEIGYLGENARTRALEELEWRIACDRLLRDGVIASEAWLLELCWSGACSMAANPKIWRAICLVADDLLVGAPVPEESVIDRVCFTQASHRPNLFL